MRLLLDSHILISLLRGHRQPLDERVHAAIRAPDTTSFASVASLWEIAIKVRLGKLDAGMSLEQIPEFLLRTGLQILMVDHRHALAEAQPAPATRDPFDRMLLSQCMVENLRLVTLDRALAVHPLAWKS